MTPPESHGLWVRFSLFSEEIKDLIRRQTPDIHNGYMVKISWPHQCSEPESVVMKAVYELPSDPEKQRQLVEFLEVVRDR
jgi:hypothetical protein